MREKKEFTVLSFTTTTDAMAMEQYCKEQKIPGRTIPLPPAISAGCGIAFRMETEDAKRYAKALYGAPVSFESHEVFLYV